MDEVWFYGFVALALIHFGMSLKAFANLQSSSSEMAKMAALCGWWPLFSKEDFKSPVPLLFGRVTLASMFATVLFWAA
jgi:hypothetical protein